MTDQEAFESVAGANLSLAKGSAGQYISTMTAIAFDVWQAAVRHEREACARACMDEAGDWAYPSHGNAAASMCARRIFDRSKP